MLNFSTEKSPGWSRLLFCWIGSLGVREKKLQAGGRAYGADCVPEHKQFILKVEQNSAV